MPRYPPSSYAPDVYSHSGVAEKLELSPFNSPHVGPFGPFTAVGSFAFMGLFNSTMHFTSVWPLFTYIGSSSLSHGAISPPWGPDRGFRALSVPTLQQTNKKRSNTGTKMTATTERLKQQRDKIVTDHIPTSTLYTRYLQHPKTYGQKRNYVQKDININIIYYTVYFS